MDIGCGHGKHAFFFAEHGFDVYAGDADVEKIAWLDTHVQTNCPGRVTVRTMRAEEIPFRDEFFDAIICTSVLHHARLHAIEQGMGELYRVLKQGGCLLLDMLSIEDASYGVGEMLEQNTFVGSRLGEEDVPHHYTDRAEINRLTRRFREVEIIQNEYVLEQQGCVVFQSKMFDILAYK